MVDIDSLCLEVVLIDDVVVVIYDVEIKQAILFLLIYFFLYFFPFVPLRLALDTSTSLEPYDLRFRISLNFRLWFALHFFSRDFIWIDE